MERLRVDSKYGGHWLNWHLLAMKNMIWPTMAVNYWPNQVLLTGASERPMTFSLAFGMMARCANSHLPNEVLLAGSCQQLGLNCAGSNHLSPDVYVPRCCLQLYRIQSHVFRESINGNAALPWLVLRCVGCHRVVS